MKNDTILEELPVTEYLPFSITPMIIQLLGRICFCQRHGQHLVTLGSKREFYRVSKWVRSTVITPPPQQPIYKAIYRGPNSVMFLTIAGAHLKRQLWGFTPLEDSENRFMLLKKSEKGTLEWWSLELSIIILLFQGTSKILLSDDNTHQNGQLFFLNLWRIHYIHRSIIPFVREEQQSSNGSLNLNRRISLGGWRRKLTRNASYDGKSHVFSKLSK